MLEEGVEHSLTTWAWDDSLLAGLVVNAVFALLVGATVGLLEVTLAHALIARDRLERASAPTPAGAEGLPRSPAA